MGPLNNRSVPLQDGSQVEKITMSPQFVTEVFTGIRPTGNLTVANYVGAVKPTTDLLERGFRPLVFVADLHLLTTHEAKEAKIFNSAVVSDYIALGLDPRKADIFVQSDLRQEVFELTMYLMRHVSISELMRVPTLKDKLRDGERSETASAFLANYPVMMAADILLQRAHFVPVGPDQIPHIELTRKIAERFNSNYQAILPLPSPQEVEPVKILGLKGSGKMGKSHPQEAIFLTDSPSDISKKIKAAQTAFAGEMPDVLRSHVAMAKAVAKNQAEIDEVNDVISEHLKGQQVMGQFKGLLSKLVQNFVVDFQAKRKEVEGDTKAIEEILSHGKEIAFKNAKETLRLVREAL